MAKRKKLLLYKLLDVTESEEIDEIKVTTDYLMNVESRLNQGVKCASDIESQFDFKGLNKESQVLLSDITYLLKEKLSDENNKENYLEDIFEVVDKLKYPYINYRFWTLDKSLDTINNKYLDMIKLKYKVNELSDKMKLENKVYLSLDSKFDWPSTSNNYYKEEGTCLGGKSQIAILSNGVVSICCLDSEGESNLGNIFTDSIEDILNSNKFKNTIKGVNDNKVYLDICKHCSYKERFNKKNK